MKNKEGGQYDHKKIEAKWQKIWQKKKFFSADDNSKKPKFYGLIEFPYPSGEGLHVGHVRSNTAMDIICRKRRAEGFNVLYPIGWDAFGLPTENYAIKTGVQPAVVTKKNAGVFRKQLQELGFSFDWTREINTTDPNYYKWTQWIFLKLFEKGLAYKKKMAINWCPKDKIGLANEEVVDGCCERCGTPVEKREKEQWMLAITKYADRLDKDLDTVDYLEKIKIQQRNWIGKSEGAVLSFRTKIPELEKRQRKFMEENPGCEFEFDITANRIEVFTTRADTLFGVTYLVLAPEHRIIKNLKLEIKNWNEVEKYVSEARKRGEIDRTAEGKEKTGVELKGIKAINPANGEEIPIFIADYVLPDYGTGAIMAVPAHDERDFEFAKKFNLPIKQVILKKVDQAKSYLMGAKNISDEDLGKIAVIVVKKNDDGDREILIPLKSVELYKKLISEKLSNGFWNEYVGENITFVFKNENGQVQEFVLDEKNQIEIKNLAEKYANTKFSSITEMLAGNNFYTDYVIHTEPGKLFNSGKFDEMQTEEAAKKITELVGGKIVTTYKLRDWVFSRQHYWGEPIPLIFCDKDGWVPVPEKDLPVKLPKVKNYKPTDNGESPLSSMAKWVNVKCPKCGGKAKRETDTMPNWAGSSWYYLRYTDPKNKKVFADMDKMKYWTPVDWYNGGMEHVTLHLLYSRFWHKFLFDLGLAPTSEPYKKRTAHGLILAEGGVKMSKSKGNVVNPDEVVKAVGADSLRLYEMFIGPFDQPVAWNTDSIAGVRRFVEKVWRLFQKTQSTETKTQTPARTTDIVQSGGKHKTQNADLQIINYKLQTLLHQTIKKVGEDIENMRFNTAVSALMILANAFEKEETVGAEDYEKFLKLLAPFAPHIAEELWSKLGHKNSIAAENWPAFDGAKIAEKTANIMVQVNGKIRGQFSASPDIAESEAVEKAKSLPEIQKWFAGKTPKKIIFVKGKLISLVI